MRVIDAPGIFDMDRVEYDSDPAASPSLNQSLAKVLLDRSPAHAFVAHPRLNEFYERSEQETKFDVGQVVHELLLGHAGRIFVVTAADWRTKAAQAQRDEALAAGKLPILINQFDNAVHVAGAARAQIDQNDELAGILDGGSLYEQSMFWNEGDVWLRGRPDVIWYQRRIVLDIKTTKASANPEHWSVRQLYDIGADIQSSFYPRGLEAITGEKWAFRFAVIETEPPFGCSILALDPQAQDQAERKVSEAIRIWGECIKAGRWPGYARHTHFVGLPVWQEKKWTDREGMQQIHGDLLKLGMEVYAPGDSRGEGEGQLLRHRWDELPMPPKGKTA